jgi:hypothetical protein
VAAARRAQVELACRIVFGSAITDQLDSYLARRWHVDRSSAGWLTPRRPG